MAHPDDALKPCPCGKPAEQDGYDVHDDDGTPIGYQVYFHCSDPTCKVSPSVLGDSQDFQKLRDKWNEGHGDD